MGQRAAAPVARLFFGLPVPGALAGVLAALAADIAAQACARPVPPPNLHATLAFLGAVPRASIPLLRSMGDAIRASRCVVDLDRVGSFRGARVAWIGASAVPAPLTALQRLLAQRLREGGWELDTRPFHFHVTLARHCRAALPSASMPTLRWTVDRVALFESIGTANGPRYDALAAWPLATDAAGDVTWRR